MLRKFFKKLVASSEENELPVVAKTDSKKTTSTSLLMPGDDPPYVKGIVQAFNLASDEIRLVDHRIGEPFSVPLENIPPDENLLTLIYNVCRIAGSYPELKVEGVNDEKDRIYFSRTFYS